MKSDRKDKPYRIPIRFTDAESEGGSVDDESEMDRVDPDIDNDVFSIEENDASLDDVVSTSEPAEAVDTFGGPDTAELIATRSELKRVAAENAELKDRLARRQADFENYRKRV